ncbi:autotransporter [Pusillimonas sp. T7-7]|uniref:autotransporter domain-containing protein n=1 Tax=Pusillimonas sp. (strain T7-7) TaxID=1007105 RepID=UPI000208499B|nr:autotransporter domain-containing protein [Pusillimonas sp. T7-7]AEC18768.1 autotransporter [Pusillimonas sp. T7-7]
MNRMYRIIFNRARGVFQVVSEQARGQGKSKAVIRSGATRLTLLAGGAALGLIAVANPARAETINGGAHEVVDGANPGSGTKPSPWDTTGFFYVGVMSEGELTIRNRGIVNNSGSASIGRDGGTGTVTVTGTGSTWNVPSDLYVGSAGSGSRGTLTIANGGLVTSNSATIGTGMSPNRGEATVAGSGSRWEITNDLYVGRNRDNSGFLTIEDGGKVKSGAVHIGHQGTSSGQISVERGGILETGFIEKGTGSASVSFDGGILRAANDEENFMRNFVPGDMTIHVGGATLDTNGFDIGVGTALEGAGGLTKLGDGKLTLSGANSYSGGTTVEQGALFVGSVDALVQNGAYTINGGTLDLNGNGLTMSSFSGAGGTLDMGSAFVIINQSGDTVYEGDIVSTSGRLYKQGNGQLTLNGQISGLSAGLYVGGGTLALNNANSYGYTYLGNDAVLEVGHDQALGTGSLLLVGSGTLRANTDLVLANRISFFDPLSNHLTVDGGHNLTLTGDNSLAIGGSVNTLTKTGAGILTLSGDTTIGGSFDPGTTIVQGGTLRVDRVLDSTVTVYDGATLGGSGTVGTTTVADGGILAPGNSIGTLTVAGNLSLSSGSILDYELGSPGASGDPAAGVSDRIEVSGDLQLDGTLNLAQSTDSPDGAVALGYYRLMTYGEALSGSGLAVGTVPYGDASLYQITAGDQKVDLFVSASLGDDTLQHWQGGDGVWNGTDTRWLNQDGGAQVAWAGNHAIFKNQPGGFNGGAITVEGTQQFKGLQFVDDGYRLQGAGSLETDPGGSEIRVLAERAEIATNITGTGGITKTEAGTLVLSGANTYEGGTTISAGVLSVENDANLGHEDGALAFNGGVLQVTGTAFNDTERDIAWGAGGGGFDIADAANDFYLDRNIVGTGDLVKRGAGALWLAGANAYGNTRVEGGSVFGNTASLSGNLANAGSVTFNQAANGRFAGDITGWSGTDGVMIKEGAGVLTLDGRSTLDWTVAQGGLTTAAARFSGDVLLDGAATALTFTDVDNAVYGGAISGVGNFTLDGGATVTLTGDSSAFAGTTTLANGALLVGNGEGSGALGGSLKVLDGATLGGSGTVGSGASSQIAVASGGTLAPGNSIGTLTVDGDLVFESGSIYAVEVDPAGAGSDRINVTGNATLNGGAVAHVGATGDYNPRSTYTILSAGGTLSGAFDKVTSDFAFLTPDLNYDYGPGTVGLELVRNERDFASAALTRNQTATAQGIESIGLDAGHAVYDAIVQLPDNENLIRASFDALSGEIHASAKSALIEDSRFIRNAANDRLRGAFGHAGASVGPALAYGSGQTPTQVDADHAGPVFWSHAFGAWGKTDGDGNAASLDRSTGGLLIGADRPVGDWRVGVLGGYSHTSVDADARRSSGKSDNYHLGVYGGTQWGDVAFRTGAAYSWHKLDTTRSVAIPGINERLSGNYDAGTFQVFGELAYGLRAGHTYIEPFANLAYVSLHTDRFGETGGDAALTSQSDNTDVTFSTLGVRVAYTIDVGGLDATLTGLAGWRHAFGDHTPISTHAFSAGDAFSIAGAPIARDSAVVEAGVDLKLTSTATLGIAYIGQLSGSSHDHGLKANVAIAF